MRCAKSIKFAFVPLWKACHAVQLAQSVHTVAATSQDFVRVGLVTHIPNQTVMGGVENIMQRHSELDRAEV